MGNDSLAELKRRGFGEPRLNEMTESLLSDQEVGLDLRCIRVYFPAEEPEALAQCEGSRGIASIINITREMMDHLDAEKIGTLVLGPAAEACVGMLESRNR